MQKRNMIIYEMLYMFIIVNKVIFLYYNQNLFLKCLEYLVLLWNFLEHNSLAHIYLIFIFYFKGTVPFLIFQICVYLNQIF